MLNKNVALIIYYRTPILINMVFIFHIYIMLVLIDIINSLFSKFFSIIFIKNILAHNSQCYHSYLSCQRCNFFIIKLEIKKNFLKNFYRKESNT